MAAILVVGTLVVAVWVYAILTEPYIGLTNFRYVATKCGAGNLYNKATWNATFTLSNAGGVDGSATVVGLVNGSQSAQASFRVPHFGQVSEWLLLVGPDCVLNHTVRIYLASVAKT